MSTVQRLQKQSCPNNNRTFEYINVRGIDIVKRLIWINVIERREYFVAHSLYLNVFVSWHLPIFLVASLSITKLL